jgi:hypothetical protein
MATPAPSHHPPNSAPKKRRRAKHAAQFDDMDDSHEIAALERKMHENPKLRLLADVLKKLQKAIFPEFQKADKNAQNYREEYQRISAGAVYYGAAAVSIGILEFAVPDTWRLCEVFLEGAESIAAVICLYFIWQGVRRKPKENWLLARYQAENLRLLKFRTLTDPGLWCGESESLDGCSPAALEHIWQKVNAKVRELMELSSDGVNEKAAEGVAPEFLELRYPPSCYEPLKEFIRYYCAKRLDAQMKYLKHKRDEDEEQGVFWRLLTGILFFGSFIFVLVHLFLSYISIFSGRQATMEALRGLPARASHVWHNFSKPAFLTHGIQALNGLPIFEHIWIARIFLVAAALLPAVVAGVRSYRASREYERNALRHGATLHSLQKLSDEMVKAEALVEQFDRDEMRKARALAQPIENDQIAKAMDLAEGIERDEIAKGKVLAKQFEIARFCELVLEFDTFEFLRLIREMEWYG